jgi:hypothetical protein
LEKDSTGALDFSTGFQQLFISHFFKAGRISRPAVKARNLKRVPRGCAEAETV